MFEENEHRHKKNKPTFMNWKTLVVTVIICSLIITGTVVLMARTVPAGYKGVLLNWGEAVSIENEGFHWIAPIGQDITLVNIQIQKAEATESTASSDMQEVTTTFTVNYQIDSTRVLSVYKDLRNDYEKRVIIPNIQESLKAATAKYVATQLITEREAVKDSFMNTLKSRLSIYGINVLSVSVTNFQFSPSFTKAIEDKVTAEQNALAAKNKLEQITYEAQQQVIQADANATAILKLANANANATIIMAKGNAEAMSVINATLTPEYISYLYAIGWDGKLPLYWSGNGSSPFVMIPVQSTNQTMP